MGVIRSGTLIIEGKEVRIKVFGIEDESGTFIPHETFVSKTDLINIGVFAKQENLK